jgi:hypothetical protein
MRELKPITETHYPIPKSEQRAKRWVIAQSRKNFKDQRMQNTAVEAAYLRILDEVKAHYLPSNGVCFERDYRRDKSENCFAMHSFITSSFYWYLECDFLYNYRVEYDFGGCPFESDILAMLKPYPLDRSASRINLMPDFRTFVLNVFHCQDESYPHSLKGD